MGSKKDPLTIESVREKLTNKYQRTIRWNKDNRSEEAMLVKKEKFMQPEKKDSSKETNCEHCGRDNHTSENCHFKVKGHKVKHFCNYCKKPWHQEYNLFKKQYDENIKKGEDKIEKVEPVMELAAM